MSEKKEYDLAFSIGEACLCSSALRLCSLQFLSFPFDWVAGMPLVKRVEALVGGFRDFIVESDLKYVGAVSATGKDVYRTSLGLVLNHDFPIGVPLGESFPVVKEKYGRRAERLLSLIEASRRVLVVYSVIPDHEMPPKEDFLLCREMLSSRFPGVRFDFFITRSKSGFREASFSEIAPGITLAEVDYSAVHEGAAHNPGPHNALLTGFRVKDYRSDEERRRFLESEKNRSTGGGECFRKENIRIFGNIRLVRFKASKRFSSAPPFHARETPLFSFRTGRKIWAVVRQRGELEREQLSVASESNAIVRFLQVVRRIAQAPVIFTKGLFRRRKRFSHFLLLGYNCELAYRFVKANGFIDSNFFAWTYTNGCRKVIDALADFGSLFTGDLAFVPEGKDMLADVGSGIQAHMRNQDGKRDVPTVKTVFDIESEKDELRSRMAYLREKFLKQLRDDKPTLAVIKLLPKECPGADALIKELLARLNGMGAKNLSMLVICQKADAVHFPSEHPDYYLRTVSAYNPGWRVATEQVGDRVGWMTIWKEFVPERKIIQNRKYKFDRN